MKLGGIGMTGCGQTELRVVSNFELCYNSADTYRDNYQFVD